MRFPIRNQIILTFSLILLAAIGFLSATSAWLAVRLQERVMLQHLQDVTSTLESSTFPLTANVLKQMKGLSGADFVVLSSDGTPGVATVDVDQAELQQIRGAPNVGGLQAISSGTTLEIAGETYFASHLLRTDNSGNRLLVLYPQANWVAAQRTAAWPPLAIGAATMAFMSIATVWLMRRLSRRIENVRGLFRGISRGEFGEVPVAGPDDEIADLTRSANELSRQLLAMQQSLKQTERMQLLAQLAGGLAHQLRNDITGARLAMQLHGHRCHPTTDGQDESLSVALRQLKLTEEHVNRFLSLGPKHQSSQPVPGSLQDVVEETAILLQPTAEHAKVRLDVEIESGCDVDVRDFDTVRTAVVNLTMNAIEAAGSGGAVTIALNHDRDNCVLEVKDTGSGPSPEVAESLFDPFVTSKPEGVGLGLAIAHQTAADEGGRLSWTRDEGQTVFQMRFPNAIATGFDDSRFGTRGEQRRRSQKLFN